MKSQALLFGALLFSLGSTAQAPPDVAVVSMDEGQVDRGYLLWHLADEVTTDA